jgi:ParB/RepB/Spo0J family partition protein
MRRVPEVAVDLELHQLDLRYQALRRRSARKERSVLASLSEIGQQTPVVVLPGEGEHEMRSILLDGYKRVRALKRLGRDTVRATAWALPEPEALLLERLMRNAEADSALEQGWLIRELCERCGLSLTELAKRFDKSASWVSRRLQLVSELPESIQKLVLAGQLQPHAAMKHLVPLARTSREEAEALARACGARQFSTREVAALCAAWRGGTGATRELILKSPELVLRAQDEARRPKQEVSPEARLLNDFSALCGIAHRATRVLRGGGWAAAALPELHRASQAARAETEHFFSLCRKELLVVGPEHQNCHPGIA